MKSFKSFNGFPNFVIALLLLTAVWFKFDTKTWTDRIIAADVIDYYSYLPAAFVHNDLSLEFLRENPDQYSGKFWPKQAENGKYVIKMSMGMSYVFAPFFATAHLYESAWGGNPDGFSPTYPLAISIGALVFLALGLIATRKLLLKYFSPLVTGLTLILLVLATNMLYYATREPGMSHVFNFSLIAVALLQIDKWLQKPHAGISISTGLLIGLIALIRPSNVLIVLLFILWKCTNVHDIKERIKMLFANYPKVLLMILFAFIVWIPQMLYWKIQAGSFLYNSYGEHFYFNNFHMHEALFGYRKGWFVYTPVMLFAFGGLLFMKGELKKLRLSIVAFMLVFMYIVFSWWCWWYGGSFGSRPMVDVYALMALPLAALIDAGVSKKIILKIATVFLAILFSYHGVFQTYQYFFGAIHFDSNTKQSYWNSFGHKKPSASFYYFLQSPDYENAIIGNKEVLAKKTTDLKITSADYFTEASNIDCTNHTEFYNLVNIVLDTSFKTSGTALIPQCESNHFCKDLLLEAAIYNMKGECLDFTAINVAEATGGGNNDLVWDFPLNLNKYPNDSLNIKLFFWTKAKKDFSCKETKIVIRGINNHYTNR